MDLATLKTALLRRLDADRRAGLEIVPRGRRFDFPQVEPEPEEDTVATERSSEPPTGNEPPRPTGGRKLDGAPAEILRVLSEDVAGCRRCGELADTRDKTVFGVGDPHAAILFLGEAPGADEDRFGEPFVGRAGQLLDRIIAACRLKREEIYICNVLKCRPPGNRNPAPAEAANCREYLDIQLETVDPDYIVCWGKVAAANLLGVDTPIGKMRKKFFTHGRAKVACTYHPSYLLRNPSAKKQVWEDLKWLFADMGVELG